MVSCPKCNNKIAARKLMLLTRWNTVTCPKCSEKLQIKNTKFGSLLGASGAAIEIIIFDFLYFLHPSELMVIAFLAASLPILFIVVLLVYLKILELKVKS